MMVTEFGRGQFIRALLHASCRNLWALNLARASDPLGSGPSEVQTLVTPVTIELAPDTDPSTAPMSR